jgi:hypothetical protein
MCGGSKGGGSSTPPPAPAPTGPVVANYSNVDQRRQGVATSTRSQMPTSQGTPMGGDLDGEVDL